MKFRKVMSLTSMVLGVSALAGCGGDGGGGVNSVNTVSAPPAPTNTSLASLRASQSFTNNAATGTASFDLASSTTLSGSTAVAPLTIAYDAGTNSYSLSTQGRSQTFAPANLNSTATSAGQSVYIKSDSTTSDRLTLISASVPGASASGPQYVGMGYWQHNAGNAGTQNTTLDIFTYGLDTPASAVPRTGQATYATNVFGLATTPGKEPVAFQGGGQFNVSFQSGVFSTSAYNTETGLVSGNSVYGGNVNITGAGHLSSSDGTFSGTAGYSGASASGQGSLSGRFYGPGGTELGATFSATGTDGSAASGAIVGVQNASLTPVNLTLTNPVVDQNLGGDGALITNSPSYVPTFSARADDVPMQLTETLTGSIKTVPGRSDLPYTTFTAADMVAPLNSNFTSYSQTTSGQTTTLDLYKPGSGNTELALTYLSFGRWTLVQPNATTNAGAQLYFVFGIPTSTAAIAARTGSAHYAGVAYGAALDTLAQKYSVTGTSSFDVDFSHSTYVGALALKGSGSAGNTDFGNLGFAGTLTAGQSAADNLTSNGTTVGGIAPRFFGPNGEEIGGPFHAVLMGGGKTTTIVGAAVAKGG